MKIAVLITHPYNIGGGHVYLSNLASALRSRGHTLRVFAGQRDSFTDMTGAATCRWSSASQMPCAPARPSPNYPTASGQLQAQLLKRSGGDREMVDMLNLVLVRDEPFNEQASLS